MAAFVVLLDYGERAAQIAAQILVANCQSESSPVTPGGVLEVGKAIATIGENYILTLQVTSRQKYENGGSGGARTRNLCRDRAAL